MPLEVPIQFEEVLRLQRMLNRLPQLILRNRIHRGFLDDARVIAMDYLAENPRIRVCGLDLRQYTRPERARHRIRSVETPTGGPTIEPIVHHAGHIVNGFIGLMVECNQIAVPLEYIQSRLAIIANMRTDQTMPRVIGRIQAAGGFVKCRLNGRMIAAHMIEHAVQYHLQSHIPASGN